jgi:hypothetical protein
MHGIYRVYKNNEIISESNNLITSNGKDVIHQYMAGIIEDWASSIAIGAYNTAATINDYKLNYEISRFGITTRSPINSVITSTTISGSAGSTQVVVGSSAGLSVGQSLVGTGINSSATVSIVSISGASLTMSHANTASMSGATGYFKTPKSVKFKATVPEGIDCIIYELGIFTNTIGQSPDSFEDKIITNFDEDVSTLGWTAGTSTSTYASYSPRLSNKTLNVAVSTSSQRIVLGSTSSAIAIGSASSPAGSLDLDTKIFSNNFDTAKLLVYSTGTASITVKGQDNSTITSASPDNAITLISNASVAAGVNLVEAIISKGSLYNDTLSKLEISYICGSGSVGLYFDSLKFSHSGNFNIYHGLVSRSVLATPIVKTAQESIDIEYEIYLYS